MSSIIYDLTYFAEMLSEKKADTKKIAEEQHKIENVLEQGAANIYLYVSPRKYPLEFQIKDEIFPQGVFLHDFSNYYLVVLAKIYLKLYKKESIFFLLCLWFLEKFFQFFVSISSRDNILRSADYYYSEKERIPRELKTYRALKKINSLNDIHGRSREKLNIIFRMCDKVSASSASKRCFKISKNNLIKKTLYSLQKCVENYKLPLKIYCVADNCSEDIVSFFLNMFPNSELIRLFSGNAKSFCECVELACRIPDGEQVYFIEDDYLMLNENVLNLLNFNLEQLSKENGEKIAIMPDDYPDRYKNGTIQTECRVTEQGHFLKIDKTTCTFATYSDVVKKNKKTFLKFINWPRVTEEKSVNKVWKRIPLYQPVPAWTLHCQTKSVVPIYLDYKRVKDYFENHNKNSLSL